MTSSRVGASPQDAPSSFFVPPRVGIFKVQPALESPKSLKHGPPSPTLMGLRRVPGTHPFAMFEPTWFRLVPDHCRGPLLRSHHRRAGQQEPQLCGNEQPVCPRTDTTGLTHPSDRAACDGAAEDRLGETAHTARQGTSLAWWHSPVTHALSF